MENEKQLVEMMAQIVEQNLELAKNLKVVSEGLAEAMRRCGIEYKIEYKE